MLQRPELIVGQARDHRIIGCEHAINGALNEPVASIGELDQDNAPFPGRMTPDQALAFRLGDPMGDRARGDERLCSE